MKDVHIRTGVVYSCDLVHQLFDFSYLQNNIPSTLRKVSNYSAEVPLSNTECTFTSTNKDTFSLVMLGNNFGCFTSDEPGLQKLQLHGNYPESNEEAVYMESVHFSSAVRVRLFRYYPSAVCWGYGRSEIRIKLPCSDGKPIKTTVSRRPLQYNKVLNIIYLYKSTSI